MSWLRELLHHLCGCDEKRASEELEARVGADWAEVRTEILLMQRRNRERLQLRLGHERTRSA